MSRHVERCSRKFLSETGHASRKKNENNKQRVNIDENLAFVAALSRPRTQVGENKLSNAEKRKAENDRQALRAAKLAKRRATMQFLTYGAGKQVLDKLVLGNRVHIKKS